MGEEKYNRDLTLRGNLHSLHITHNSLLFLFESFSLEEAIITTNPIRKRVG